ncbi:MAG: histidine phosphatase family protein [Deltaproteobacteria bacterium]|nr:histidine phosphatase family protein [Deltaproteobacteria bacterium]
MLVVHLVRHGETDWNRENRFQGRRDVPLNDAGRAQAVKVAAALADRPLAAVRSSALSRARETAERIAEGRGIEVVVDDRLAEMDFGDWEGLTTLHRRHGRFVIACFNDTCHLGGV